MIFTRRLVTGVLAVVCLVGCGGSDSTTTSGSSTTTSSTLPPTTVAPSTSGAGPTMVTSAPVPITGGGPTTAATSTTTTVRNSVAPTSTDPTTSELDGSTTSSTVEQPLVLRASGLGTVMFGTDPDTVIAAITDDLGAPTRDSGWTDPLSLGSCPGTKVRTVQWSDLSLYFGDESTVVTGRDHFFAYSYGPAAAATAVPAGLAIDGGGTIGTTVADLRAAHPAVQVYPSDPTAPASFAITDGLTGQLTGATDADTVTRVQGGIGCGE